MMAINGVHAIKNRFIKVVHKLNSSCAFISNRFSIVS